MSNQPNVVGVDMQGVTIWQWLDFAFDPIPDVDPGSLFSLSLTVWDRAFYDNLKHLSYSYRPIFTRQFT